MSASIPVAAAAAEVFTPFQIRGVRLRNWPAHVDDKLQPITYRPKQQTDHLFRRAERTRRRPGHALLRFGAEEVALKTPSIDA
ncbi:MAG TPA: hypothetical protein VMB25_18355 [Bryobacteraceae bacterium]|nr:hypothetical protein [Bryobacteraceae bacterium]